MHRSEMALRYNLLPRAPSTHSREDGEKERERPKVRPLNEAKAIANGANFLSEAFLFAIAAGLIVGESWRSSNNNKKQRNRTEEKVEEVAAAVKALCDKLGVDSKAVGLRASEEEVAEEIAGERDGEAGPVEFLDVSGEAKQETSRHVAVAQHRHIADEELKHLQATVDVFLRLAINSGWVQGPEALNLTAMLNSKDDTQKEERGREDQVRISWDESAATIAPAPSSRILQKVAASKVRHLAAISRKEASPEADNR